MRHKAARASKRAVTIPIGIAGYALAVTFDIHTPPDWVLPAAGLVGATIMVTDRIGNRLLQYVIIKGYVQDYRRQDANDYVTMFRDLDGK